MAKANGNFRIPNPPAAQAARHRRTHCTHKVKKLKPLLLQKKKNRFRHRMATIPYPFILSLELLIRFCTALIHFIFLIVRN
jgi:hypothetical protein